MRPSPTSLLFTPSCPLALVPVATDPWGCALLPGTRELCQRQTHGRSHTWGQQGQEKGIQRSTGKFRRQGTDAQGR